jgi:hypothetical protein
VRPREKGGKRQAMACHHNLDAYLSPILTAPACIMTPRDRCSVQSVAAPAKLTRTALPQANAYAMIRRRAAAASTATKLGNRSFRVNQDPRLSQKLRHA